MSDVRYIKQITCVECLQEVGEESLKLLAEYNALIGPITEVIDAWEAQIE